MRLVLSLAGFALLVLAAYAPGPVAPPPEAAPADSSQWENLQVLPDSISRDTLIGMMRGFTEALGVRCDHCHARGEEGPPDFPSDANPHKEVARDMMRMTWQINRETLPAIEGLHEAEGMRVTCYTCHRGAARPATAPPATDEEAAPGAGSGEGHPHGDH